MESDKIDPSLGDGIAWINGKKENKEKSRQSNNFIHIGLMKAKLLISIGSYSPDEVQYYRPLKILTVSV